MHFRNDDPNNINSHIEMWRSEFELLDSTYVDKRFYKGRLVNWMEFRYQFSEVDGGEDLSTEMYEEWDLLERHKVKKVASGVVAWHLECWKDRREDEDDKKISSQAEDQGLGSW